MGPATTSLGPALHLVEETNKEKVLSDVIQSSALNALSVPANIKQDNWSSGFCSIVYL